jgi:histidinol dehydrogenase
VLACTREFDRVDLGSSGLSVPASAFDEAAAKMNAPLRDALVRALANIETLHKTQVPASHELIEVEPGVWCGERWTPIDTVCLYVPRGRGAFSSVLCMLGVPARLAGVRRVVVCTPPGPDGRPDAASLFVAGQLGIEELYCIGGAQAVAAVAFGTETVPRCDKIVGPGNVYVTAARQLLAPTIDPGPPAGPSESLIVCDETADPQNAAWNLMIEAEHGENSCAWLLTHDEPLAGKVAEAVAGLRQRLAPDRQAFVDEVLTNRGGILLTRSLDDSVAFANRFAAEHVAVMVAEPWSVAPRIRHAGEILLGDFPIISLGNYVMGINAILPTGGWARTGSGISVLDFMKRTSLGFVTQQGFDRLRPLIPPLSEDEGFSAHHEAVLHWRSPADRETLRRGMQP